MTYNNQSREKSTLRLARVAYRAGRLVERVLGTVFWLLSARLARLDAWLCNRERQP